MTSTISQSGSATACPMPSILDRKAAFTLDEIDADLAAVPGIADPAFLRGLAGADRAALPRRDRR